MRVEEMKIYTKKGDAGQTSLFGGGPYPKDAVRIEAYGTVDELNAALGVARLHAAGTAHAAWLERIQNDLFDVGADLCVPPPPEDDQRNRSRLRVSVEQVAWLEDCIDTVNASLPPLTSLLSLLSARFARPYSALDPSEAPLGGELTVGLRSCGAAGHRLRTQLTSGAPQRRACGP